MKKPAEEVTLGALGRLPARDRAEVEALVAEDRALAEQFCETEKLAIDLWQASSPLKSAPEELWSDIEAALTPNSSRFHRYSLPLSATLGWAAALVFAVLFFWPSPVESEKSFPLVGNGKSSPNPRVTVQSREPKSAGGTLERDNRRLREQLMALQEQLGQQQTANRIASKKILILQAPGSESSPSPAEREARLLSLLAKALQEDLLRREEDPVDLVIEKGWNPEVFAGKEDLLIRHRDFLGATAGQELMIAPNGDYYDPNSHFLWSPAEDGGGYLGRAAGKNLDLSPFDWMPPTETGQESLWAAEGESPDRSEPVEGYVIEDEESGEATLILEDLPSEAAEGRLFARFISDDGFLTQQSIEASLLGNSSVASFSLGGVNFSQGFTLGATLPDGGERILMESGIE
ncbi:hypothetical protein [Roseibacillus persicicus]|uniref:Uncharacterized protein n=1 Tax=Roseibacillus persicicus TaxID=454148 RepID=A0A918THK3_9BACT|nr:hypothetical protein [Roseibacillus persicicus]GHC45623.1 hypothetical protein GCM10007100_08750 [Roseibacillus persicicus]